ncbi:cupin-like domain-containing protein [Nostoc sp. CHAB 5824]|nr:cupin-like domain-containing protein [Nostoc sp. CHAB 5824]
MQLKPIERIKKPTVEEFQHEFVMQDKPVIISGVANEWLACSLWKPDTFKSMFGNVRVPVRKSDNEIDVFFGESTALTEISIADYIDSIQSLNKDSQRPSYLGNLSLTSPLAQEYFDKLKPHFEFPNYFPENSGFDIRIWIGAAYQKSTIHNDPDHNFNAQIFGKKVFLLFAPKEYEKLYVKKVDDELWSSPINPQQPNLEMFPLFSEANGLEAVLNAGDILFIPAFWWHQALSITTSININMWLYTKKICKIWEQHPTFIRNFTKA